MSTRFQKECMECGQWLQRPTSGRPGVGARNVIKIPKGMWGHVRGTSPPLLYLDALDVRAHRFRGGLVFKAHRLCVSLNFRIESNKEEEKKTDTWTPWTSALAMSTRSSQPHARKRSSDASSVAMKCRFDDPSCEAVPRRARM